MKIISFLSGNFQFLGVKFSIHLNRRVFVMNIHFPSLHSEKIDPTVLSVLRFMFCLSFAQFVLFVMLLAHLTKSCVFKHGQVTFEE